MELEDDGYLSAEEFEQIIREQMALYTQVCTVCRKKPLKRMCAKKERCGVGASARGSGVEK